MQMQELVALIIASSQKIDTLWQIFITVHFGVFTLIFVYFDRFTTIRVFWKLIVLVSYFMFLALNFTALRGAYRMLDVQHKQFRKSFGEDATPFHPEFFDAFVLADLSGRGDMLLVTHSFALICVVFALFFSHLIAPSEPAQATAAVKKVTR